jgi:hypothetical protein
LIEARGGEGVRGGRGKRRVWEVGVVEGNKIDNSIIIETIFKDIKQSGVAE